MIDLFDEPLVLAATEEPVRARDAGWLDAVRPCFSGDYYATLDVEPLADGFVRVLWNCDRGVPPMGPFTVFRGDEWMAVSGG